MKRSQSQTPLSVQTLPLGPGCQFCTAFPKMDRPICPRIFGVSIQHLREYKYASVCSREKILEAQETRKSAEKIMQEEAEQVEKEQSDLRAAEIALLQPYQKEADKYFDIVCRKLYKQLNGKLNLILEAANLMECVIGQQGKGSKELLLVELDSSGKEKGRPLQRA